MLCYSILFTLGFNLTAVFAYFRFIWALCILAAVSAFAYANINNLLQLLRHEKSVNVGVEYKDKMDFPAVTICNFNLYT